MKNYLKTTLIAFVLISLGLMSCKKIYDLVSPSSLSLQQYTIQMKSRYSTVEEFRQGITQVNNLLVSYHINAYLDTLPNGLPNKDGRKLALSQFGYTILEKLNGNQQQVASAVYDVFHFDEATFSLIS